MEKLEDNIKPGYFFAASEWWGLSDKPGARGIFVYPNGSYIIKAVYAKSVEPPVMLKEDKLEPKKLEQLKVFIKNNIKENSYHMIFDYGCSIKTFLDNKEIKVENNQTLFSEMKKILPFQI